MIAGDPGRLRRRSISLGVPVDDADDVAQTAVLRAWKSIEHLHTPGQRQMCSWLDAIARNAAADLARQHIRRPTVPLDEHLADDTSVDDEVELHLRLQATLTALHALPDALLEPLLLTIVEGLTAPEIADRLGIAPAAVRQRISRARKALTS